jgi:hypothetical protein
MFTKRVFIALLSIAGHALASPIGEDCSTVYAVHHSPPCSTSARKCHRSRRYVYGLVNVYKVELLLIHPDLAGVKPIDERAVFAAVVKRAIFAEEAEPVVERDIFAEEPEPVVPRAIFAEEAEPIVERAIFAEEAEPVVERAIFAEESEPVVERAIFAEEPEPVVERAIFAEEPEPVVERAIFAEEAEPVAN